MKLKQACIDAVNKAAGRRLSRAELQQIDERIGANMRQLARKDRARWQGLSNDARVLEAAEEGARQIQHEAALKVMRAQMQVLKTAATDARLAELRSLFPDAKEGNVLSREINQTDHYITGVRRDYMRRLTDLLAAVKSGEGVSAGRRALMVVFDADNPAMTRDFVTEVFGNADGATRNDLARKAARAWLDVADEMRSRFNDAGGDVGKLSYGYIPQPHNALKIRKAGITQWISDTLPKLDRSRYLNEDGTVKTEAELIDVLREIYTPLATDGLSELQPGTQVPKGSGAHARRHADHRQLHFVDGDAYLQYLSGYGQGSMWDAMVSHVGGMARDIGLVERYGPNPNQQFKLQDGKAEIGDGYKARYSGQTAESMWNTMTGASASPKTAKIAQIASHLRNIETFGKLAGAVLSSVTDIPTYFATVAYNRLSYWDAIRNITSQSSKETRDFMAMHGFIADSMISDLNRWSGENLGQAWSGQLASSTMKLSLMNAWTDTLRRGLSMSMMQGLARMSKLEWGNLNEWDQTRMRRAGITQDDWDVIRAGKLTEYRGTDFLTPDAIKQSGNARADEVVAKVLGLITDESEHASLNPDLATRSIASFGGLQRGTIGGELARSMMQFKSFPVAMMTRHWRRMMEMPGTANRVMYGGALFATMTMLGGLAVQSKQVVQGKDPLDMTDARFWLKAAAQGGGLSIAGDFLLADTTQDWGNGAANYIKNIAGPLIGSAADLMLIAKSNFDKAANGDETHAGAQSLRWARSHLPYVNLWYARAAFDHAGLFALQENLSPGYLSKMERRARRSFNQGYWWRPEDGTPSRAPDIGAAFGG
ncbi:hypothetical protein [Burkholderia contaminans]|uniref:hypothetical protein n=1 Tax=Burkholderia contaminans TaxID=488447 RepID=UPI001584190E|nr:hypothetical protein [Burkholderia contaminans]